MCLLVLVFSLLYTSCSYVVDLCIPNVYHHLLHIIGIKIFLKECIKE